MWFFWIVAGLLAAATAAVVAAAAARAARDVSEGIADPEIEVHRRHLAEVAGLAERGLLAPEERRAAEAEAGRRLLAASDRGRASWTAGSRASRMAVAAAAAAAAVAALALYLVVGSPGVRDQPFRTRLAAWRAADPATLQPDQMAAVLQAMAAQRPRDPQVFDYLGRAELAADDAPAAVGAFSKAVRLDPASADRRARLGEALVAVGAGKVSAEARAAFREALRRDPANAAARYWLAQARIDAGDVQGGLTEWRALAGQLAANDPRLASLTADIARVEGGGPVAGAAPVQASGGEQAAFIRAMVAGLAERLKTNPEDAEGWARLVRSYRVLGDAQAEAAALAKARSLFTGRPQLLDKIEAEARR